MATEKALFVPLKREYFEEFAKGTKTTEYRLDGPRWNARTCRWFTAGFTLAAALPMISRGSLAIAAWLPRWRPSPHRRRRPRWLNRRATTL